MKYEVSEVYTPDDRTSKQSRNQHTFESDSTDVYELARAAWRACHSGIIGPESEAIIRRSVNEVIDDGQLEDFESDYFEFVIFGNSGEWFLEVQAKP